MSNRLNSEKITRYDKHPQDQCVIPSIQKARTLLVSTFFPRRFLFPALASKFGFGWIWHHSSKTNSPSYLHQIAATQNNSNLLFPYDMFAPRSTCMVCMLILCHRKISQSSENSTGLIRPRSPGKLEPNALLYQVTFKYDSHNGHNATWKSSKQLSLHIEGEIECSGHDIPSTTEEICLWIPLNAFLSHHFGPHQGCA